MSVLVTELEAILQDERKYEISSIETVSGLAASKLRDWIATHDPDTWRSFRIFVDNVKMHRSRLRQIDSPEYAEWTFTLLQRMDERKIA